MSKPSDSEKADFQTIEAFIKVPADSAWSSASQGAKQYLKRIFLSRLDNLAAAQGCGQRVPGTELIFLKEESAASDNPAKEAVYAISAKYQTSKPSRDGV